MLIKKIWYKITNKKKYFQYKSNKVTENKIKWFKNGFENKIYKIQKNTEDKKELSFQHSGHLGDVIHSLAFIKELSKTHRCNLYIKSDVIMNFQFHANLNAHPAGNFFLNKKMISNLLPLLKSQSYINDVDMLSNQKIDIDLDLFREVAVNMNLDSVEWYFHLTGLHPDLSLPYLFAEPHKEIKNKVVILRTLRRINHFINYNFLKKYENLIFIGLQEEFEPLKKEIPNLEFYNCKNFLEMTQIIKSSKFFLGNDSFGYSIAEALKIPRLLECSDQYSTMHPNGKNAYKFCFQNYFEKWFDHLYSGN